MGGLSLGASVGLMTIESKIYNYGGVLQEFALQQIINSLGFECVIINYDRKYDQCIFSIKNDIRNMSWNKIKNRISTKKTIAARMKIEKEIKIRHKAFDLFREEFLDFTECCNVNTVTDTVSNLKQFVCGSDQIWNPDYCIPALFLEFVPDGKKRIIYAASVGKEFLKNRELRQYKHYFDNLDFISVREESAKKNLEAVTKKPIQVVLDPTLLLDKKAWKTFSKSNRYNNYIFCYFLGEEKGKRLEVIEYAKKNGLKIITLPYLLEKQNSADFGFGDVQLFDVGPQELLGLIENAKIVLTDSFHVSVFSIIFKKQFYVFGRNIGNYNMNTRIDDLLKCFGLEKHYLKPGELELKKVLSTELIYNDTAYKKRYAASISYLNNALNNISGEGKKW